MSHKPYDNRYLLHNRKYHRQCKLLNIFSGDMSRNARVGENGENSANVWRIFIWGGKGFPLRVAVLAKWYIWRIWRTFTKVLAKFQMRWQRGSLKVAILTKKANLAKVAKMAHSRQSLANVPTSYDVAKAPLWEWRFWRKWQILRTSASFRKNSNEMAKGPFEREDFHENGEYGENSSKP